MLLSLYESRELFTHKTAHSDRPCKLLNVYSTVIPLVIEIVNKVCVRVEMIKLLLHKMDSMIALQHVSASKYKAKAVVSN